MTQFVVESADEGTRVDFFIANRCDSSRANIQKLIKSGHILINESPCKPNDRIKSSDTITVPELEAIHPTTRTGEVPLLNILYENDDLLVIHKPSGFVIHAFEGYTGEPTIVDALLEQYPAIAEVGEDPSRPGIIHRLDKDVSGLMVIAKNQHAFHSLKSQFQSRSVYKEYIALVYGSLPKDHDVIDLKIARSRARGRMVARPVSQEGKEAKTEYMVEQRYKKHTLVHVILHTGRTHQIRVHFRAIDHPIVGDKLYKKTYMKYIRLMELDRIFLHAYKLRIRLMDDTERTFTDPLPKELESILKQLP